MNIFLKGSWKLCVTKQKGFLAGDVKALEPLGATASWRENQPHQGFRGIQSFLGDS